ncbi:hypothetical protein [Bosea sp. (in: a-proteobacteria)]|jgi:hypothetical protein|uniref:hypothetical protein n=1 Tax=Bosea sp. (in: a-proteobacteria) TaxID=1871050 RepID=UPI003F6FC999
MVQTNIAYVRIERLKVTRTQEGINTGLPKEMGTHEWHMKMTVNGQTQWWTRHGIETGGEYKVGLDYLYVPLIDGKLHISISGWEQDTFGDTELSSRSLTLTPAEDCPYGVNRAWVTSYSSGYYGQFIAEEGMASEGGFDFRITIQPIGKRLEDNRQYAVLIRDREVYQGYWVSGWDAFTKNIDDWRKEGLRLSRIASCEAAPGQPSFSSRIERTYIGVFEAGDTGMPFWELDRYAFAAKILELRRDGIRPTDIYAFQGNGTVIVGGTFDRGGDTDLVVEPRAAFEKEWQSRSEAGQGLISLDSFSDGRQRWFAGLFEHGIGNSALWVADDERGFRAKDAEWKADGWRLIDICTYNEGGSQRFSGVWRRGARRTWLELEPDWGHLVGRIDFNWGLNREIVAIDSWSSAASD